MSDLFNAASGPSQIRSPSEELNLLGLDGHHDQGVYEAEARAELLRELEVTLAVDAADVDIKS